MLLNKIGLYILAKASWITRPFTTLSLLLDGIVYTVVAYVYKIFILMAQIKFSEIYKILEPLIDRVKALIMVLVMFKLGKSLIEYMIDPAKATDKNAGGAALVKNLFFTAALLILYPFIFGVMSDISLLIIGSQDGNYEYIGKLVDAGGGGDTGLLARFIWGSDVDMNEMDVGGWLAHQTFTIFLHDISSDGSGFSTETVDTEIEEDGKYVFTKAHNLVDEIDITVEYTLPFVSTIMGLYLIYSIAVVSIEIGVRMFKMIILQILAPLAIITIIDKGISSPTFKTFCKTYISVFLEAITRIAIVFIVTTFVGAFMDPDRLTSFFGSPDLITENVITRGLICIVVLVAGYRIVGILPKFIDQALGTSMAGSASGSGFGKFAAGLVGGAIGFGSGLVTGIAGGAGVLGTAGNMLSGAVGGYQSGGKGKNVADFFRNQSANAQANRDRAARINAAGGGLAYARGRAEGALGITAAQNAKAARYEREQKAYEAVDAARIAEIENQKGENGLAYGKSADDYVNRQMEQVYNNDKQMQIYALEEQKIRNSNMTSEKKYSELANLNARKEARKAKLDAGLDVNGQRQFGRADYQKSWNNAYSGANGSAVQSANRTLSHTGRSGRVAANSGDRATIQAGGQAASSRREGVVNSGSYQRGQGQSGK